MQSVIFKNVFKYTIRQLINSFWSVSGYKINFNKSILFSINNEARQLDLNKFPFKIIYDSFKYLGISVTSAYKELFRCNFAVVMERIKKDLNGWSLLPISLAGRINTVKMFILPRFLFLFQNVPLFIPKSFFKELDKHLSSFIWNKSIPRIRKAFLERQKDVGGLALSNFMYYYWSCNIDKLIYWAFESGEWTCLGRNGTIGPVSLFLMLCAPLPHNRKYLPSNPLVTSSLKIWPQFRSHFKQKQALSLLPITSNALFPSSLTDHVFQVWSRKGLRYVRDFFQGSRFIKFEHMIKAFGIPKSNFYRYLQVRSLVKKYFNTLSTPPPHSWIEELDLSVSERGLISTVYSSIQRAASPSLDLLKKQWEEDFGSVVPETVSEFIQHLFVSDMDYYNWR